MHSVTGASRPYNFLSTLPAQKNASGSHGTMLMKGAHLTCHKPFNHDVVAALCSIRRGAQGPEPATCRQITANTICS